MKQEERILEKNKIFVASYSPDEIKHETSLMLVHGSWGGGWMWKEYIEFFIEEGWVVYTVDFRGHGRSGGVVEGATMEDYVSDIEAAVGELDIKKPIVIGHSMGSLVALMYGAGHSTKAIVSIDGSPSIEVQKESKEMEYPKAYTPIDAGMPEDLEGMMKALPDLVENQLTMIGNMLGKESGVARSERKKGISVAKEALGMPLLFLGAELGKSVLFGIDPSISREMADYYGGKFMEIKDATHPGILMGKHALDGARAINDWISTL